MSVVEVHVTNKCAEATVKHGVFNQHGPEYCQKQLKPMAQNGPPQDTHETGGKNVEPPKIIS